VFSHYQQYQNTELISFDFKLIIKMIKEKEEKIMREVDEN